MMVRLAVPRHAWRCNLMVRYGMEHGRMLTGVFDDVHVALVFVWLM